MKTLQESLYDRFKKSDFGKKDDERISEIYADWGGRLPEIIVGNLEERERMIRFLKFTKGEANGKRT